MRKQALSIFFCLCIYSSFGASNILVPENPKASEFMIPLFGTKKVISLQDYLKLTPESYKQMTGEKMKFKERIQLVAGKKFVKKMIRKDGTVNMEKMKKNRGIIGSWEWHWGGFALGFFLSLLGPIVALFFNDDYKWDRFHTALWTAVIVFALVAIGVAAAGG